MAGLLSLFAGTEVFVYVFVEIATKISTIQRVIMGKASLRDNILFILVFGGFSILGTYLGAELPSGAIMNIRDLAPMIAGLAAGPLIGLGVGLIGGVHRLFLGGLTFIPCALATVFAGLIAGIIYKIRKGRFIDILPGMLFAILIEVFHAGLTLLIARPFEEALIVVKTAIPAMMIANSLGIAIAIIIISKEIRESKYLNTDI